MVGVFIGSTPLADARIGGQQVAAIFVGSTQVWPTEPPQPSDGNLIHMTGDNSVSMTGDNFVTMAYTGP